MRRSLYLKDDDYRLSFLYGTSPPSPLHRSRPRTDRDRGAWPLYVSIHATTRPCGPAAPQPRGATSLRWLARSSTPASRSTARSCVPRRQTTARARRHAARDPRPYPRSPPPRSSRSGSARTPPRRACGHHRGRGRDRPRPGRDLQARFVDALGRRLIYAADEYYLLAGRPFPERSPTTGSPSTRTESGSPAPSSPRSTGPSPATRAADAGSARVLRLGRRRTPHRVPRPARRLVDATRDAGAPVGIVTGGTGRGPRTGSSRRCRAAPVSRSGSSRSPTGSSAETSPSRPLTARRRRRRARRRTRATATCPRRRAVPGPVPRRTDPRRPAPPGGGRRHRRGVAHRALT